LGCIWDKPQDIMVSFDVALVFNRVLIMGTLNFLSQHFDEDILRLLHQVLTSSFLSFRSQLNILTVLNIVSPLPQVTANYYRKDSEMTTH
jgi:hypothetical protein